MQRSGELSSIHEDNQIGHVIWVWPMIIIYCLLEYS